MPGAAQERLEFALERCFRHLMYARDRAIDCGDEGLADDLMQMCLHLTSIQRQQIEDRRRANKAQPPLF